MKDDLSYTRMDRCFYDGVEVLRYKIELPNLPRLNKITEFYRGCADKAAEYCEGELSELARSEYISSDMSQKKFRYKGLVYKLCGRVTYENDGLLFIYLTASLEGGGRERVTSADGHAWDKADEGLLPPNQAIRRVRPDIKLRRKLRKSDGIVYLDGVFYSCTKGSLQEIKIKS